MELMVYEESEQEPLPVLLKLESIGSCVVVNAVDTFGRRLPGGALLTFHPDGRVYRPTNVDPSLGFQLDPKGRIMVR